MAGAPVSRVPTVAGLAFIEAIQPLPESFSATLATDPYNQYNPRAIMVRVGARKIGYVAPEIARQYYDTLKGREEAGEVVQVPARRERSLALNYIGVLVALDLGGLSVADDP